MPSVAAISAIVAQRGCGIIGRDGCAVADQLRQQHRGQGILEINRMCVGMEKG
jgi:hypothetical protein